MVIVNAECATVILFATLSVIEGLRCYVCDSRSVIGYYDAEKDCNTDRSLQQCPDIKASGERQTMNCAYTVENVILLYKACMIEAFRHDAGAVYHIIKRCLVECPAFVNGSAEHTRCCAKEACNDVISIDVIDHRTASDLVADVREQPARPPQVAAAAPPRLLTDDSPHLNNDNNVLKVEHDDNEDDNEGFQRRRPPASSLDLWTPPPLPLPPAPSARSTQRPGHGLRPPTVDSTAAATSPAPRRDRRPPPGSTSGTQWWKGGPRSSSTSQRSAAAVTVIIALYLSAYFCID